jgi:hypothetical protein
LKRGGSKNGARAEACYIESPTKGCPQRRPLSLSKARENIELRGHEEAGRRRWLIRRRSLTHFLVAASFFASRCPRCVTVRSKNKSYDAYRSSRSPVKSGCRTLPSTDFALYSISVARPRCPGGQSSSRTVASRGSAASIACAIQRPRPCRSHGRLCPRRQGSASRAAEI